MYLLYAWITPEQLVNSVSPVQLHYDGVNPQYRDYYAARASSRYVAMGGAQQPNALNEARDVLGVSSGDVTPLEALQIVRAAEAVARAENVKEANPDQGRFSLQDQQNLAALAERLDAAKGDPVARSRASITERNTFWRWFGALILGLLAALAGLIVWMMDKYLNGNIADAAMRGAVRTPIRERIRPTPAQMMDEDDIERTLEDDLDLDEPRTPMQRGAPLQDVTADRDIVARPAAPNFSEQLISTFNTQYEIGDDDYDEGFQINGAGGELIGELGATASERIGLEMPYKFAVLSVWLFDKLDFQSTTKVLMTDYAYNDSAIKDKLKVRGDLILARNGVFEIVTSTMRVEVEVTGIDFAPIGNEPHGYFENVNLQFRVYRRPLSAN
jgi:hypothetical protein